MKAPSKTKVPTVEPFFYEPLIPLELPFAERAQLLLNGNAVEGQLYQPFYT